MICKYSYEDIIKLSENSLSLEYAKKLKTHLGACKKCRCYYESLEFANKYASGEVLLEQSIHNSVMSRIDKTRYLNKKYSILRGIKKLTPAFKHTLTAIVCCLIFVAFILNISNIKEYIDFVFSSINRVSSSPSVANTENREDVYETIPLQFRNVEYEMHCVKVLDKNDIKKIYLEKDVGGGKVSIFAHSNPEISIFSSGRIMGDDLYAGFEINETYYNLGKFYMDVYDERIKAEENWASEIDFCGIKLLRICGAMGLDYYHTNYYSFHDGKPGTFLITSGRGIERDIDNDGKEEIISSSGGSTSSTFIYKYENGCIKECHLNPVLDNAIAVFYDENTNNFLAYYPDGKFKSKRFKYNGEEMLLLDMEYRPGQFQNYLERVKERLLLKKKE